MQNRIILATVFPIINSKSVRMVEAFHRRGDGQIGVTLTDNPLRAQRFGAEVDFIIAALEKMPKELRDPSYTYSHTHQIDISVNDFDDGRDYKSVDVVVEIASNYEASELYNKYVELGWEFKQEGGGYAITAGLCEGNAISVTPAIHTIGGVRVLYLNPTGTFIDWDKVCTWAKSKVREDVRIIDPQQLIGELKSRVKPEHVKEVK